MPDQSSLLPADDEPAPPSAVNSGEGRRDYVVIARRYRPQRFDELIGQEHVARALEAAITSGRIGHAFLFTGARGTGKTSTARILAKALNCVHGPTPRPCNECDICRSISTGDDVDALEIDGASNRRIDEIRQLRQNVNIRPSRARFKVYIIDEVHMLTNEAFNALLKTLEEPPEHVKFIFCTTEPDDIPITILSRCQRFDFAGVDMAAIAKRLGQICRMEGVEAEPDALMLLARRAAGSMRDSQSLLEQLLAFGNQRITVQDVHEMLGTASAARVSQMVRHFANRDTAGALAELEAAVREGVDVGQLLEQLLAYCRDLMITLAGCPRETLLYTSPDEHGDVMEMARQLGMETILAIMQIIDQTAARLRYSVHTRALAELALVRICTLENVDAISGLVAELRGAAKPAGAKREPSPVVRSSGAESASTAAPAKKKWQEIDSAHGDAPPAPQIGIAVRDASSVQQPLVRQSAPATELSSEEKRAAIALSAKSWATLTAKDLVDAWETALANVGGMLAEYARGATISMTSTDAPPASDTSRSPGQVVATFSSQYNFGTQYCERAENRARLEQAVGESLGCPIRLVFVIESEREATTTVSTLAESRRTAPTRQRISEKSQHPLVRRAVDLFDARVVWMEDASN
jgi:DNA polymerase-3 subunit gamma/tau